MPHPGRTVTEPAELARPLAAQRGTYVVCTLEQGVDLGALPAHVAALRGESTWVFRHLEAGHFPMISVPDALAALLADVAEGADAPA